MTAVFVPEKPSRFTKPDVPDDGAPPRRRGPAPEPQPPASDEAPARPRRASAFSAATPTVPVAPEPEPVPVEGYVLFAVGATTFAVVVGEVREIVRAARLELLQLNAAYGHGVALVDVRGRSIPVVDLRSDREAHGDVLLPMWRHQVGLVVDHVVAVHSPREMVREHDEVPAALPSYARGVLRPAEGGAPVLLIAMPDAAELEADADRTDEPRLGEGVLAELGPDDVEPVSESG